MRWLLILLVGLGTAALLLAFLPLKWVTDRYVPELQAQSIGGSIWDARLAGATFQGVPIGDLAGGLKLAPLLRGEAQIGFRRLDGPLEGVLVGGGGTAGIARLTGSVDLPLLPAPLPPLTLALEQASVRTARDGGCVSAGGRVRTSIAALPGVGPLPLLAGEARCEAGVVLVPLRSAAERVGMDLAVAAGGLWTATLRLTPDHPVAAASLALAGFRRDGADMVWTVRGTPAGVSDYGATGGLEVLARALTAAAGAVPLTGLDGSSVPVPSPPMAAGE